MIYLVTGGSGSGKSAIAEDILTTLDGEKYYVATMHVYDEEGKERVKRHRKMREDKGFLTIEQPTNLTEIVMPESEKQNSYLIECMSNLLANEMYDPNKDASTAVARILADIMLAARYTDNLVFVSNEIFSDGITYDASTNEYIKNLGQLNCFLAQRADVVIEAVCGLRVYRKGQMR